MPYLQILWPWIKFIAMVIGFFTVGLTFFSVGLLIIQSVREAREYERANERLDSHIRKQFWGK